MIITILFMSHVDCSWAETLQKDEAHECSFGRWVGWTRRLLKSFDSVWPIRPLTVSFITLLAEIIMLEQNVALYRMSNETRFFVVGSALVQLCSQSFSTHVVVFFVLHGMVSFLFMWFVCVLRKTSSSFRVCSMRSTSLWTRSCEDRQTVEAFWTPWSWFVCDSIWLEFFHTFAR
jgi:hypothetical protein